MATRTISPAGGAWTSTSTWVEGIVPNASDDVVATSSSGNLSIDGSSGSPNLCRSIDFTNYVATATHTTATYLRTGGGGGPSNVTFVIGMTYTTDSSSFLQFIGSSVGNLTTAGFHMPNITFATNSGTLVSADNVLCYAVQNSGGLYNSGGFSVNCTTFTNGAGLFTCGGALTASGAISVTGGTATFSSTVSCTTTQVSIGNLLLTGKLTCSGTCTLTQGTLSVGTGGLQCTRLIYGSGGSLRTLNLANCPLVTLTGTGVVVNAAVVTNLTFTRGLGTIEVTDTSATTKTFTGGGLTYPTLKIDGAPGAGLITINGADTFAAMVLQPDANVAINTSGITLQQPPLWQGTNGHPILITSASPATPAPINCTSGTANCTWLNLTDSKAQGGATFYAGASSINTSDNSGWIFSNAPVPGGMLLSTG